MRVNQQSIAGATEAVSLVGNVPKKTLLLWEFFYGNARGRKEKERAASARQTNQTDIGMVRACVLPKQSHTEATWGDLLGRECTKEESLFFLYNFVLARKAEKKKKKRQALAR